ncbi:unnamed protein product [Cylindrotheca closterium]|uniref:Orn/DAP/Arg decarboxylase 2 C-terminal domain-containing protein n=1 Tax=Cylindrotheca closterium TaxID=2856 RepID=A0AAD2FZA7_9STRA|nr:unnamed protein product [Cylindrotheca closterium]
MSESRSRVFLLLDLAAITQTHVSCRKRLPKVRLIYSTKHNASAKLLAVLGRLGMDLRVGTNFDMETCRKNCNDIRLWDDPSCTGKTNSYYRRLILDVSMSVASSTPLIVDGHDELRRLVSAITRMSQRRQKQLPALCFIMKVDGLSDEWKDALSTTHAAASSTSHRLVGISLDLLERKTTLSNSLALLSDVLVYCRDELGMGNPQLHLTAPDSIDPILADWLSENSEWLSLCTLDISHILVKDAGAICTRIIGVKQNQASKIHYYIDDGCYGSLSNHSKSTVPVPLKAKADDGDELLNSSHDLEATVWGPTCDGIDKVCVGKLPKLCRDDWLVFGNTGFCDVGTTFNGFAPPDVVYCALGGVLYPSAPR